MTRVWSIGEKFFGDERPERALAYFRVAVTLVLLWQAAELAADALSLFGRHGFVQWEIAEAVAPRWSPSLGRIANLLASFGISSDVVVQVVFVTYVAALCAVCAGMWLPASAPLAWLSHMTLTATGSLAAYGLQSFATIALFYIVVVSLVALTTNIERRRFRRTVILRLLQLHLSVAYFASGIEKASGVQWWNGEAIWRAVMQPQFSQFDAGRFAQFGAVFVLGGWTTLLIEIGYPFGVWFHRTRRLWCAATILLHFLIAVCLGLWLFSAMMVVLTMTMFSSDVITAAVERVQRLGRHVRAWCTG